MDLHGHIDRHDDTLVAIRIDGYSSGLLVLRRDELLVALDRGFGWAPRNAADRDDACPLCGASPAEREHAARLRDLAARWGWMPRRPSDPEGRR